MSNAPDETETWSLNNIAIVFIAAEPQRVWDALTQADLSRHAFLGDGASVGEEGGDYIITYDGQPHVTGKVLIRQPPTLLRVTWVVPLPPDMTFPNCEIEYRIEAAETPEGGAVSKLTISELTDGPVPPQFRKAGQTGWALIASRLKSFLETGKPMPVVKPQPPK